TTGKNRVTRGVVRPSVDLLEGCDLRSGEATCGVSSSAKQRSRVEVALPWVTKDAVGQAVPRVAGCEHGSAEGGRLASWKLARGVKGRSLYVPHRGEQQVSPVVGGCTSQDAVIVLWEALSLHQSLAPTIRATGEI